jgi:transposase
MTNGFVEDINGAMRTIMRTAFGDRNLLNFKPCLFVWLRTSHAVPQ